LAQTARVAEGVAMNQYDFFEVYADRSMMWRGCVDGAQLALSTLETMSHQTKNECFATNLRTKEVIGRVNEARTAELSILNKGNLNSSSRKSTSPANHLKAA
jgi:hypothetical protein